MSFLGAEKPCGACLDCCSRSPKWCEAWGPAPGYTAPKQTEPAVKAIFIPAGGVQKQDFFQLTSQVLSRETDAPSQTVQKKIHAMRLHGYQLSAVDLVELSLHVQTVRQMTTRALEAAEKIGYGATQSIQTMLRDVLKEIG